MRVASVDEHETARGHGAVAVAVAVARLTQLPSRQDLRLKTYAYGLYELKKVF